ncbi:MAG: hypothetical protein QUS33_05855 [Dehalococcoidia bacterium]|nr:hypothetical protein [Dehalococcoidia bacterium]
MAAKKETRLAAILPRLKSTDISPLIRVASVMVPRIMDPFFKSLDDRQKRAMDKVMPPGKGKKIYVHLRGTPTPPIVVELAQPIKLSTMAEKEVKKQKIRGIGLTVDDIQILVGGRNLGTVLKFLWRIKGQMFTIVAILWLFRPLLLLGPSSLKDMRCKLANRWQPLLDLLSR